MRRCVRLLGSVLALFGCGDEARPPLLSDAPAPVPLAGCESFSYEPCDVLEPSCQSELSALMACLRGEGEVSVPVQLLAEDEAATFVMDRSPEDRSEGQARDFRSEVRGLELLGLLEPGLLASEADVVEATLGSVLAFYLTTTQEIVIIDRGEPLDGVDANTTLAHEIVHALQDRRHDLGRVRDEFVFDTDSDLALASLVEGEASFYELMLRVAFEGIRFDDVDLDGWFTAVTGLAGSLMLQAQSPMLAARGTFPYTYGARFAGERWLEGGAAALDALYRNPPVGTREVMAGAFAARVSPAAPRAPSGHELVSEDTAGAWIAAAVLARLLDAAARERELIELAGAWRGDHLWVYRSTDADSAIAALWVMEFSDEQTARTVADLLSGWALAGPGASVVREGSTTRLVVTERSADAEAWQRAFEP